MNTSEQAIEKLNKMISGIQVAMLTTLDDKGCFHSRPMANQQLDSDGCFWFFTDDTAPKSSEIKNDSHVSLTFVGANEHRFVAVSGQAELIHDQEKMKELWNPLYKAFFPQGLDTPHICLIKVQAERAEYWDTSLRSMVHLFEFAKALTTGKVSHPGKNQKLDLTG